MLYPIKTTISVVSILALSSMLSVPSWASSSATSDERHPVRTAVAAPKPTDELFPAVRAQAGTDNADYTLVRTKLVKMLGKEKITVADFNAFMQAVKEKEHGNFTIDLSGLKLTNMPIELNTLVGVTQLMLANNKLTTINVAAIPPTTKYLGFSGNLMKSVPTEIGRLTWVEILGLSNMPNLTGIPVEIGNMKALTNLSVYNSTFNQAINLKSLPVEALKKLPNLQFLTISGTALANDKAAVQALRAALPKVLVKA